MKMTLPLTTFIDTIPCARRPTCVVLEEVDQEGIGVVAGIEQHLKMMINV